MVANKIINQSLREFDKSTPDNYTPGDSLFLTYGSSDILPPWGYRRRDRVLRDFWYATHNTLVQGAFSSLVRKVAATGWEVKGGRNLTRRYQDVLQDAEFGDGWRIFLMKVLTDYLTQDFGAVIEVIGAGNADKPLKGPALGLAHLDSLRCLATNDPEYPIVYQNVSTNQSPEVKYHRMHRTRVIRLVDMPSSDERFHGNGLSALSRLISVSNAQMLMGKYQNEKLSDLPPLGFMTVQNVRPGDWENAIAMYEQGRQSEGQQVYRQIFRMESHDPGAPIKVDFIQFANLPDGFNYREYMEIHVNMIALALGVDPQDIWPLSGAPLGTGTQSVILHAKGQSKGYGDMLTMLERVINQAILPEALEFQWKYRDPISDKEEAETAKAWADMATAAGLSDDEKRMLLAAKVPAMADVLFDAAGNIRLNDSDPKGDEDETVAEDAATLTAESEAEPAEGDDEQPAAVPVITRALDGDAGRLDVGRRDANLLKAIQSTRVDFEGVVEDALNAALSRAIPNRTRFGTVMRAHIAKYGRLAMLDGLKDGGVDIEALEPDDQAQATKLIASNSAYVSDLSASLFADPAPNIDAAARAGMWANKTLTEFYNAGLMSADANGMYEWVLGNTEHCDDCQRLSGQKHRLKEWSKSKWLPQSDRLECHGFNCQCRLVKTTGRAKGSY